MTQPLSGHDLFCDQHSAFTELKHILQSDHLPNAMLFTGTDHPGKRQAALFFSKTVNCLSPPSDPSGPGPCSRCRSCRKIDSHAHPDMIYLDPGDKKKITVSKIREIAGRISSKPNEAGVRVVMVFDADKMTVSAQNAMLKMLEEPPDKTVFLLAAPTRLDVLPTILSRCREIGFIPLSPGEISRYLTAVHGIDPTAAWVVSHTCDGSRERAHMLLNINQEPDAPDWIERRAWILAGLFSLLGFSGSRKPVEKSGRFVENSLFLAERISARPDMLTDTLRIIRTFFRDMLIFRFQPDKMVNRDFFDSFTDICEKYPYNKQLDWMKHLFETQRQIEANASVRLALEVFFLQLPQQET